MTLLLDIEDCILNYRLKESKRVGFDDWVEPTGPHKWMGHYSPDMIELIQASFGDTVYWHSELVRNSVTSKLFPAYVPIGPYPDFSAQFTNVFLNQTSPNPTLVIYPEVLPQVVSLSIFENYPLELSKALLSAKFWQLTSVALGLMMNLLPDKVVWVGPEITRFSKDILTVLNCFGVRNRFRLYNTRPCWRKDDIIDARDWLYS